MSILEKYNKTYKLLLIIPLVLLILSFFYLYTFYQQHNDFILKDVSLKGGTTITVYPNSEVSIPDLQDFLSNKLDDVSIREVTGLRTSNQEAVIIESSVDNTELKSLLEEFLGYSLNSENSTIEFTGSFLSEAFYSQLIRAILFAFVLMAVVVFILFRTVVPSLAVILSAFADIVMTLAVIDIIGLKLSAAGIVAFLMLIGYSVDTDIMLTSHLLKQSDHSINKRMFSSLKTGLTMTLTSIAAVFVALLLTANVSEVLKQIFLILTIGLGFDLINTWFANASILKWYLDSKK
jgi:preprotein translocase subunit SecF